MGYQSGINQLLGIVGAGGYLGSRALDPQLDIARASYAESQSLKEEDFKNYTKELEDIHKNLSKKNQKIFETEAEENAPFTSSRSDIYDKQLEAKGIRGKTKLIKSLNRGAEFTPIDRTWTDSWKEKAKAKIQHKQDFTKFKEDLKAAGVSEKYIASNKDTLKQIYKGMKK